MMLRVGSCFKANSGDAPTQLGEILWRAATRAVCRGFSLFFLLDGFLEKSVRLEQVNQLVNRLPFPQAAAS